MCVSITALILIIAALYFIGGIRATFSIGLGTGGPVAYWPAYLICMIFVFITAAVLAEICSALPAAGSIYLYVTNLATDLRLETNISIAGLLKLEVVVVDGFSASSLLGGLALLGQPLLHTTVSRPQTSCFPRSLSSTSPFRPILAISSFVPYSGLWLRQYYV